MTSSQPIVDMVESRIRESEVLQLSREMIRIPSVYGQEKELAEFIYGRLDSWGLSPRFVEVPGYGPNVVVDIGNRDLPKVVFNGHMDTVEVMSGWVHDPFGAVLEDGRLYGLGSLDMKCGLAAMMIALKAMSEESVIESLHVSLHAVSAEEKDGSGTRRLVAAGEYKDACGVIVGEGFGGLSVVTHGRRGGSYYDLVVRGKSAHGALPHMGVNAVEDGARIVNALASMGMCDAEGLLSEDRSPLKECQTVLSMRGGTDSLSVPDSCSIRLVRCTIPGGRVDFTEDLTNMVNQLGLRSQVDVVFNTDPIDLYHPYLTPPGSRLVTAACDAIEHTTGSRPHLVCGVSEADDNVIAETTGLPVICVGPGESGELARYHQAEEAITVGQLGSVARVFARTAMSLY
jgi:succinyl-diaminopimelate desuccinylase